MGAIGIDVGTTNLKAVLIDDDGAAVATASRAFVTQRNGDAVTQDPHAMSGATIDALAELVAAAPAVAQTVTAVGVCAQYSSIVGVDGAVEPVTPFTLWSDQRGTEHSFDIMGRHEDAFLVFVERHGIPPVGGGLALGHILRTQIDEPEVHAQVAAYLEPTDFITARLTGVIGASQHSMFMAQLCDNRRLDLAEYDDDLVAMAGVDREKLPPLLSVEAERGTLANWVVDQTGLPPGAVVFAGVNDTAAAALATGATSVGRGGLAIGTTSVLVDSHHTQTSDLDHEVFTMPGPYTDGYLVMAENGLGGRVLEHQLTEFVHADDALAEHSTVDPFANLDAALVASRSSTDGVMFLPWMAGSLAPRSSGSIRGAFVNLSLETSRTDLVRAVAEGVAHNLAWLLPHVEAMTGTAMESIGFVGGAARSPEWAQIIADVLNRPVAPLPNPGSAIARAVARFALERQGVLGRDEVAEGDAGGAAVFEPDPARRASLDHRQAQFEACFDALLPISEALNSGPQSTQ